MWCKGSTLAWNARDVGSIPPLGTVFPIFIPPPDISGAMTRILPIQAVCMVVEPALCLYV